MREEFDEIKVSLARIETSQDHMSTMLTEMRAERRADREDIDGLQIDMESGKAQVRLLKWLAGIGAAIVVAVIKGWMSLVGK